MQSQFGTICFESVANFTASGNIGASTEFFTHLCIFLYRIQHRFTHVQYLYIHRDFGLIFCTAKMTFKVWTSPPHTASRSDWQRHGGFWILKYFDVDVKSVLPLTSLICTTDRLSKICSCPHQPCSGSILARDLSAEALLCVTCHISSFLLKTHRGKDTLPNTTSIRVTLCDSEVHSQRKGSQKS